MVERDRLLGLLPCGQENPRVQVRPPLSNKWMITPITLPIGWSRPGLFDIKWEAPKGLSSQCFYRSTSTNMVSASAIGSTTGATFSWTLRLGRSWSQFFVWHHRYLFADPKPEGPGVRTLPGTFPKGFGTTTTRFDRGTETFTFHRELELVSSKSGTLAEPFSPDRPPKEAS